MSAKILAYETEEMFYLDLRWFVLHVGAVAELPARACELHEHFNVAHEFWCFVPRYEMVLKDPLSLMTIEVRDAVERSIEAIRAVPEDARKWTDTAAGSLQNMSHPAWNVARQLAMDSVRLLSPAIAKMDAFFEKTNPSFKPTPQSGAA